MVEMECDVLIVGGGTGGCAAAMAACSLEGVTVLQYDSAISYEGQHPMQRFGGQMTYQLVPPDEHPWIESFGCTARYRSFRQSIRQRYREKRHLTAAASADSELNPGGGWVSRICYEPSFGIHALSIIFGTVARAVRQRLGQVPQEVVVRNDAIEGIRFKDALSGAENLVRAKIVIDATELGDLLPLAGAEYRCGSESQAEFGEPHATEKDEPDNVQAFTWCFALACNPARSGLIEKPSDYDFWSRYSPPNWPGPMFSFTFPNPITGEPRSLPLALSDPTDRRTLFAYRQIVDPGIYTGEPVRRPVTVVNWPQSDYLLGSVIDVPPGVKESHLTAAKGLGKNLVYWLQNDAPRHDGGSGYPEVTLWPHVTPGCGGFAQEPYHRESRRMVTRFTVTEQMVAADCNPGLDRVPEMPKSVGVGHYRIDLHPSANGHGYIDIPSLPFQIPLGALIPVRLRNLLPACKNLGVTHITNGCYRLHPVEWNVGEAAGLLAAFCVTRNVEPAAVYETEDLWEDFARLMDAQGFERAWPNVDLTLPN